ncbi:MAG: class I SAM-dependent methyltransferase [Thermoguttaceae bacterium]
MRIWGFAFMIGGFAVALGAGFLPLVEQTAGVNAAVPAVVAAFLLIGGCTLAFGRNPFPQVSLGSGIQVGGDVALPPEQFRQKTLPAAIKKEREEFARKNPPPKHGAPAFNALTDIPDLSGMPGADPMVPMYLLDKNFRILDWNEAFSLAFDHSMEGRRGQGALEWVYLLDNFKEVLEHGRQAFGDSKNIPSFDKEDLRYTSLSYGKLAATKRAYQFPDDRGGAGAGWVVLLDVKFEDSKEQERYQFDLMRRLYDTLLWSEYALCYDHVLENCACYDELLARILGEAGALKPIPDDARILDLGAGTGNVTVRLARCGRLVFAVDDNRVMLHILRGKCQTQGVPLRRDDSAPGVILIKQDANSLFGISDDYFDYVIANNVLYDLENPEVCLQEIHRVLCPGGELRLAGPAKGVNVGKVFRRIKKELINSGKFNELKPCFERAMKINYALEPVLRRWSERDVGQLLADAGFEVVGQETYYDGNGRIFAAREKQKAGL